MKSVTFSSKSGDTELSLFLVLLLAFGLVTAGCSSKVPLNPEVPLETRILWPINDVDDRANSPGELELVKNVFAPGREPDKESLPLFKLYRYKGTKIMQAGDTATVTVEFTDAKTGNAAGEQDWSLIKIDEAWRIKAAPLPAEARQRAGK